jgi:TldD protein
MDQSVSSLIDRAGLDKGRVAGIIRRGLDGADDGELFLEYKQAEMLVFDNGRLKQATYDTAQGFGLRAVKDEAVGYAHASDLSEAALARAAEGNGKRRRHLAGGGNPARRRLDLSRYPPAGAAQRVGGDR